MFIHVGVEDSWVFKLIDNHDCCHVALHQRTRGDDDIQNLNKHIVRGDELREESDKIVMEGSHKFAILIHVNISAFRL